MNRRILFGVVAASLVGVVPVAIADEPLPPEAPLLHAELERGTISTAAVDPIAPSTKTVDGDIADWVGDGTGFGGTIVRSRGELIYTDHLFDAYGADDGTDAERLAQLDSLPDETDDLTYRIDPLYQADAPDQLGAPNPGPKPALHYGDLERVDQADLSEVRVAHQDGFLHLLVRTTTMTPSKTPALQVTVGDTVHLITGDVSDPAGVSAVYATDGWVNAVEIGIPVAGDETRVAVVAGANTSPFVPANAAFRTSEPVRTWFDQQQALGLLDGDDFGITVDLAALRAGATETWSLNPGYHDRIFTSKPSISTEGGLDGLLQHYGMYVPHSYVDPARTAPVAMTMWLHWRGGDAHMGAAVSPRIFRDFGEGRQGGGVVVAPRGRGTSTWWIGEGLVDVLEVWDDATGMLDVDLNRVAVSGHSMGGNGSYVLPLLMPDRFAAALPVAGTVTQGAWTGVDFEGCDDYAYEDYSFCYIQTNSGDARAQHTRPLLDNLRNTPIAIFQGAIDELVPTSGVTRQAERLTELGYRHRYYVFPNYEHFTHPIVDEWMELARYADLHTRPEMPARVTFIRDKAFERRAREGARAGSPEVADLPAFDDAWWMRDLTPTETAARATFDGRSLAVVDDAVIEVPEAGGPAAPGQAGPYVMTGLRWQLDPLAMPAATQNGFEVTLNGASSVTLDLVAMGLDTAAPISGEITTDTPMELHLMGPNGTTTITVPTGTTEVSV